MSFAEVAAVAPTRSTSAFSGSTTEAASFTPPTSAPASTPSPPSTEPDDGTDTEAYTLRQKEIELQGEVNALQLSYDKQVGLANVSWSLSQIFRNQEESDAQDAQENGEQGSTFKMSSILSSNSGASRKDAVETAKQLEQAKTDLAAVQTQIAQLPPQTSTEPKT